MIGRELEVKELRRRFSSDQSEFVAVYGRRRVGKTFLVNEVFRGNFAFRHAGMENANKKSQLESFRDALRRQGLSRCKTLKSWIAAFGALEDLLESKGGGKKVVFLDELPWFDTPKSGFLPAFEQFWNVWASSRKDILLIICGSSTSWIVNKVLRNRGGLHNRVTKKIPLRPFTLHECEQYSEYKRLGFGRDGILECYMAIGGVAYYWSLLEEGKSVAQNLDSLFFSETAELRDEFESVFRSLFRNPTLHFSIINLFGKRKSGMTREDVISGLKRESNGEISRCLDELVECGFLRKYNAIGNVKKDTLYQLIDNFTLFHFDFMRGRTGNDGRYWSISANTPRINAWRGVAFERVCFQHVEQIKAALGISGIITDVYSWCRRGESERGAQIDMLIDRGDRMINVCEMKYSSGEYEIDADEMRKIQHRIELFKRMTRTKKGVNLTFVTTCGIKRNKNSSFVQAEVTLNDLFKDR